MQITTDTRTAVTAAIAESCNLRPDELRPEVSLSDLGVDSLAIAYIVTTLEITLGRKLPDDAFLDSFGAGNVACLVDRIVLLADGPS